MKKLSILALLLSSLAAISQPVRTTITSDGVNVTISTPVNSKVVSVCDFHWMFSEPTSTIRLWVDGSSEIIPGGRLGNFTVNGATTQASKLAALGAITEECDLGGPSEPSDGDKGDIDVIGSGLVWTVDTSAITSAKILDATIATVDIADDAVTLAKQASGTANRLQGWDGSGNPSAITVSGDASLSAGNLAVTTTTASSGVERVSNDFRLGGAYMASHSSAFSATRKINLGGFNLNIGLTSDSTLFFLDGTDKELGLGTLTPLAGLHVAKNGAASTPTTLLSGTWFTGGSATTTKPALLIEPTGTTSTAWSTSGTGLGINAASGFSGNLLSAQVDGSSKFNVTNGGVVTTAGTTTSPNFNATVNIYMGNFQSGFASSSSGVIRLFDSAETNFNRLQFGGTSNAFGAIARDAAGLAAVLADGSAKTFMKGAINAYNATTWNGSEKFTTEDAVRDKLETVFVGTTTNDNAPAGQIGEFISSTLDGASALSFTTATTRNIDTLSLTAGDWDVSANLNFKAGSATVTAMVGGISTTSQTLPSDGTEVYSGQMSVVTTFNDGVTMATKRVSIASTTNVYLVGSATFSAGTVAGFGSISARRVR